MKTFNKMGGFECVLSICVLLNVSVLLARAHEGHDHGHSSSETSSLGGWTHSANLTKNVGVNFRWIASDATHVTMEMSSRTNGYVSVGFCPEWKGSMEKCDIVVGGVHDGNGTGYLIDYHSDENAHPILDDQQDYILISATQVNWLTTITFKRKWDTGDVHDANLEKDKVQIIWSWNPEDVKGVFMKAHDRNTRGHTKVMISLKSPPPESELPTTVTASTDKSSSTHSPTQPQQSQSPSAHSKHSAAPSISSQSTSIALLLPVFFLVISKIV